MDFQEIISLVFFIAYIVYRYFLKGKSQDDVPKKPERRPRPSREESKPQDSASKKKKPSPFEEIFKELEKELGGEEAPRETKPEPKIQTAKVERDLLKEQEEMQRVAEAEYKRTRSEAPQTKFSKTIEKRKKSRKKETAFDARKAYMYKELFDRKHFKV